MAIENQARLLELLATSSRWYVDELFLNNRSRYDNTELGTFLRNLGAAFTQIKLEVTVPEDDRVPHYVEERIEDIESEISRSPEGRFAHEADLIKLFHDVCAEYRRFISERDLTPNSVPAGM